MDEQDQKPTAPYYQSVLEQTNRYWSEALARTLCAARDMPPEAAGRFLSGDVIRIPEMIYWALLEMARLSDQLLDALQNAEVNKSQDIMSKMAGIRQILKSLPSIDLAGISPDLSDQINSVVAHQNGRWPL
jgi:hypothetical protein